MHKLKLIRSMALKFFFRILCNNDFFPSCSVGFVLNGTILVNAGFVTLDLNFSVEKEPKLNLNTDVDFSTENILCMQLSQPDDVFRYERDNVEMLLIFI